MFRILISSCHLAYFVKVVLLTSKVGYEDEAINVENPSILPIVMGCEEGLSVYILALVT